MRKTIEIDWRVFVYIVDSVDIVDGVDVSLCGWVTELELRVPGMCAVPNTEC